MWRMVRIKSHFHKQEDKIKNVFDKSITLSDEFIKRTRRKIVEGKVADKALGALQLRKVSLEYKCIGACF